MTGWLGTSGNDGFYRCCIINEVCKIGTANTACIFRRNSASCWFDNGCAEHCMMVFWETENIKHFEYYEILRPSLCRAPPPPFIFFILGVVFVYFLGGMFIYFYTFQHTNKMAQSSTNFYQLARFVFAGGNLSIFVSPCKNKPGQLVKICTTLCHLR